MAKKGDIVRFLNTVGGGRVVRVDGQMAYVEDEDGFEIPVLSRECVVVAEAGSPEAARMSASASKSKASKPATSASQPITQSTAAPAPKIVEPDPEIEIEETVHGEKINVVLAFEASNPKSLTDSRFECTLVNDSNYYLAFTFATHSTETESWTLRRAGVVEPNIALSLGDFVGSDFAAFDRLNVQFVAYKEDKSYGIKRPVSVIHKVDGTKFFKAHCYRESIYFDAPVIEFEIVNDDEPYRTPRVDSRQLEEAMRRKRAVDRPQRRVVTRRAEQQRRGEAIVVDLHIDELIDDTRGLSAADMLNLQVDAFRQVMDTNLNNKGQKIIFIHGKGEGVLRQALMKELNYRYKKHRVEDAPFRDFGTGATMVIIQ